MGSSRPPITESLLGGIIDFPILLRFTAGHSVEFIVTVAFFIGVAAPGHESGSKCCQAALGAAGTLAGAGARGRPAGERRRRMLARVERALRRICAAAICIRRLRDALEHIHRKGDAESLDNEIKYLSDLDSVRAQHGYAFVRVIIWSIPILGLLGTVIGITSVFANLDIKHFDASLPHGAGRHEGGLRHHGLGLGLCR